MDVSILRAMHLHRDYTMQFAFGPHPFVAISSVMTDPSVSIWNVDAWTEMYRRAGWIMWADHPAAGAEHERALSSGRLPG